MQAQMRPDHTKMTYDQQPTACFVVGTKMAAEPWREAEVIQASTGHAQAEGGLRFLKEMTMALLVYSVTPRRRRPQWARQHETVPNQINQPTQRPTWRWVFQLLEGIHRIRVTLQGKVQDRIEGMDAGQTKILRLCGEEVWRLYQISPG